MSIYYIEKPNGKYSSENGTRKFDRIEGKEAYDYLQTAEGKEKRFFKANEKNGDHAVYVEVRKEDVPAVRSEERHKQYLFDCMEKSGYTTISLYTCKKSGEDGLKISGEELIQDENTDIEAHYQDRVTKELLRDAIASLEEAEFALISALYLRDKPLTEREYSSVSGIPQKSVNNQKKAILKKLLKNFQ